MSKQEGRREGVIYVIYRSYVVLYCYISDLPIIGINLLKLQREENKKNVQINVSEEYNSLQNSEEKLREYLEKERRILLLTSVPRSSTFRRKFGPLGAGNCVLHTAPPVS